MNGMCPGRKLNAIRKEAKEWVHQDDLCRRRQAVEAAHRRVQKAAEAKRVKRQHDRTFQKASTVCELYRPILILLL
jgi:hypothetical protein